MIQKSDLPRLHFKREVAKHTGFLNRKPSGLNRTKSIFSECLTTITSV